MCIYSLSQWIQNASEFRGLAEIIQNLTWESSEIEYKLVSGKIVPEKKELKVKEDGPIETNDQRVLVFLKLMQNLESDGHLIAEAASYLVKLWVEMKPNEKKSSNSQVQTLALIAILQQCSNTIYKNPEKAIEIINSILNEYVNIDNEKMLLDEADGDDINTYDTETVVSATLSLAITLLTDKSFKFIEEQMKGSLHNSILAISTKSHNPRILASCHSIISLLDNTQPVAQKENNLEYEYAKCLELFRDGSVAAIAEGLIRLRELYPLVGDKSRQMEIVHLFINNICNAESFIYLNCIQGLVVAAEGEQGKEILEMLLEKYSAGTKIDDTLRIGEAICRIIASNSKILESSNGSLFEHLLKVLDSKDYILQASAINILSVAIESNPSAMSAYAFQSLEVSLHLIQSKINIKPALSLLASIVTLEPNAIGINDNGEKLKRMVLSARNTTQNAAIIKKCDHVLQVIDNFSKQK